MSWLRRWANIIVIILNGLLASSLFAAVQKLSWLSDTHFLLLSGSLSLLATLIGAFMLQFKAEEQLAQNKHMGNLFSQIARKAHLTQSKLLSGALTPQEGWAQLDQLTEEFGQVKTQAEAAHVGHCLTKKLLSSTKQKREALIQKTRPPEEDIKEPAA